MAARYARYLFGGERTDGAGNADGTRDAGGTGKGNGSGTVEQAAPVTWGELGCPTAIGDYPLGRDTVRVKHIHIIVAENDPAARFTVVVFRPPLGPAELMLGHRVA